MFVEAFTDPSLSLTGASTKYLIEEAEEAGPGSDLRPIELRRSGFLEEQYYQISTDFN